MGDKPAAAAKSEVIKGDKAAAAAKSEVMKGDKLGRQAGSGRETSWRNNMAAAAKSEVMKGDKLGKQGGSGSQFPQSGTHPLRSKNPYSFQLSGEKPPLGKTSEPMEHLQINFPSVENKILQGVMDGWMIMI